MDKMITFGLKESYARRMNKGQYKKSMSWLRKAQRQMRNLFDKAGVGQELKVKQGMNLDKN